MKKMVFSLSVLLAGYTLAQVESQVVGYNTVEVKAKYTLVAINFEGIENEALSIQQAVPYADGMVKGTASSNADAIQVLNTSGSYDTYFMSNGKNGKGTTIANLEGKWSNSNWTPATALLPAGSAAWYVAQAATAEVPLAITVAGQVANDATKTKTILPGLNMIANPYASDMVLNSSIPYTEGMIKGTTLANADTIQILNSSGNYDSYFMSNGKNGKGTTIAGLEGKWSNTNWTPADSATVVLGAAAWYTSRGSSSFTIEIDKPYSL